MDMEDYDWKPPTGSVVVVIYLLCISIVLFTSEYYNFHSGAFEVSLGALLMSLGALLMSFCVFGVSF